MSDELNLNGLLVMPVSVNGASMRNILNVLFSPIVRKKYKLPEIKVVSFLHQEEVVKSVLVDNDRCSVVEACHRLVKEMDAGVEVRFVPIVDYAKEIPQTILKAVKEVGKANLVLDLTSGKKDITGILYTAACISEIENMIYIDVCRNDNTGEFYSLSKADAEIEGKVKVTKFETISEMENLASLNHMDFIIYKKSVQEILPCDKEMLPSYEDYAGKFNHAIDYYFRKEYQNCIREIGLLNESIAGCVAEAFLARFNTSRAKGCSDLDVIMNFQRDYERCADPKRRNEKEERRKTYDRMYPIFSRFPAIFEMVSAIQNYRNLVSHDKRFTPMRDDAKLVIDLMLRVCRSMSDLKWFADGGGRK